MVQLNNLRENPNLKEIDSLGVFHVFEYQKDLSVTPLTASTAYFMHEMNLRRRQVLCILNGNLVKTQAGAMQFTAGNVQMTSGVKGVGGFIGKAFKGAVTGESLAKPEYTGSGYLMLEPTYKHIILERVETWGSGIVLDDGLFLACDGTLREEIVRRTNVSSALLGGEGLFNLGISGQGVVVLESPVPRQELIEFVIDNDEVRIDGNMAIAWSKSLTFTVEKSSKSLIGSAISGEGFVNFFRGTGKILMAPTVFGTEMNTSTTKTDTSTASKGILGNVVKAMTD